MNIGLPEQNDIYTLGFDRSLNRDAAQETNGGATVYNAQDTIAGQTLGVGSNIGGWNIGPNAFSAGTGSVSVGFSTAITSADDVRIYAGNNTPSTAPFRVTESGALFATNATVSGSITGSSIHIPDQTTSASFHVNTSGDTWWGANVADFNADHNTASAYILNDGTAQFLTATITGATISSSGISGSSVSGSSISSIPNSSSTDIALLDFTHDLVFSSASKAQVNWASGTITMSNGRSFSISSGNTSTMAAKTYIYLDTAVSSTVLQITTTATTAMGANKKLIAVAQNGSAEATFQVNSGIGGLKLTAAMTSISNNDWTYSGAFSVTDSDTIAWASGTLTTSNGGSYSITGSNTGNMTLKTYVYFDLGTSATALQTTTTASTAIGDGKILMAVCKNGTSEANFMLMNDNSYNIDAANIVAGSITANEIAAATITGAKIAATTITASNITAATITTTEIAATTITGSNIATLNISGKSATFDTGTIGGFTMSASTLSATNFTVTSGAANVANVTIGTGSTAGGINSANASGDIAFWAGSTFANRATAPFRVTAGGAVTATSATISGYVISSKGAFGGDGSDGALSISSGTTTIDLANAAVVVKNYTSISITSTGKLAFSNPHANGTFIVLKSQGAVTVTSTATCIDASALGASGGAGGVGASGSGTVGTSGIVPYAPVNGGPGGAGGGVSGGAGFNSSFSSQHVLALKVIPIYTGGGGGGGFTGGSGGTSGAGGRGGGGLYIECGGAWNFTTASGISVAGGAGANGVSGADPGGGGGGGAGAFLCLYNTLTSNSGTVVTTGGAGGTGNVNGRGGGGGASYQNGNSNSSSSGGDGAAGISYVTSNSFFA